MDCLGGIYAPLYLAVGNWSLRHLCAAFRVHLDSQCIAGLYPHSLVVHPQPDKRVDSSMLLGARRLSDLPIPFDQSHYALIGYMGAARYLGQAGVDDNAGLL